MPDLKDNFDLFRGDLLYGQSRDRQAALVYLPANLAATGPVINDAIEAGAWVTVDNLNVPTEPDEHHEVYRKNFKDDYWSTVVESGIASTKSAIQLDEVDKSKDYQSGRYSTALDDYYRDIQAHKFSPLSVFSAPRDKVESEGWKKEGQSLRKDRYYLAIRRACKFGIEHVASQASGALIHFILNRFDEGTGWSDVLNKKPVRAREREAVIITYSELRFVYKNWDQFKTKVVFYRFEGPRDNPTSFPSCAAPWEDSTHSVTGTVYDILGTAQTKTLTLAKFWEENYSPYNARRYQKLLADLIKKYPDSYARHRGDIVNWQDLGNISLESDPEQAIQYYKDSIKLLRS